MELRYGRGQEALLQRRAFLTWTMAHRRLTLTKHGKPILPTGEAHFIELYYFNYNFTVCDNIRYLSIIFYMIEFELCLIESRFDRFP
ncbi:hypothetical protein PM3016_6683 [Paenibacillus mucilaginosus 3016]|uniref:Uncharacterized protein n=1 Tax=Paenibacillus mucilaginosus 3016 TaxID=1116391 RepID=H6NMD2_9BACL|nr:hypothetical protein PM3016_6683 [Paenibacillus mucilaginosus 3016]